MQITMQAIGVIHTPLNEKQQTPIQSSRSTIQGTIEIFPEYLEGLEGIESFSHIYLLYGFHLSDEKFSLKVQPFLDDQLHGIFSTRFPCRPNPIGISVVNLISREKNILCFRGADMLNGTPLLDIKPYIPEFDVFSTDRIGWYQNRKHP
ncbi:MAG TPA: tRNA (N6-threonylcarbamoyladenosine(37)-N6)-methyltransferase TrmO [Anaerolineaceae bacterium]|nr:tRNA (N6-threonylcarbamoyladenosine(37)-N6)-methyltransferase TrmO [Anaerolineaceae bacterium]HPN54121.1 tRNA (N6-threonylcarbamoyladenosine(37)-N6)-methyltransferase TrmO [Anaerolineaceae bacterium]